MSSANPELTSTMSSANPDPGLLTLTDLTINKGNLTEEDRRQAKYKLEQLKCYLEFSQQRPHKYALQNMIAALHYRLQEEDEATEVLEEARKNDPSNLNVLHDLAFIYDKDYRKDDALECEKMLKSQIDQIQSVEGQLVYARCLAGKGLAWAFDLHPETKGTTRLDNSITFYNQALNIAGGEIDAKEKEDWTYYLAMGYVLQNNIGKIKEDDKDGNRYKANLEKVMGSLESNLKSDDAQRKSDAWCLLGNVFSQKPKSLETIPPIVNTNDFRMYWRCPERCYQQSLEFNDKNCITLTQLARFHYDNNKFDEALQLLERSLKLKSGITNMWALHMRAQVLRIKFNKQERNQKSGGGSYPDQSLLENAKEDLLLCTEYNPYVLDMIHMAEVCHKLSWNQETSTVEKRKLKEALRWCTRAESCQDGAERPELHQQRALILQDLGDHENAVKCFMQAMDCENPGTKYNGNFIYMFNGMLARYHNTKEKPQHMLKELAYWLDGGMEKYKNTKIKVGIFVRSYPEELFSIAEVLSHSTTKRRLNLSRKLVDAFRETKTSCDGDKLKAIAENVSQGIASLPKLPPKPPSPAIPEIFSKPEAANSKLGTVPEKEMTSFPFGEACSDVQTKLKGSESRPTCTMVTAEAAAVASSSQQSPAAVACSSQQSPVSKANTTKDLEDQSLVRSSPVAPNRPDQDEAGVKDPTLECDQRTKPCETRSKSARTSSESRNDSISSLSSIPSSQSSRSLILSINIQSSNSDHCLDGRFELSPEEVCDCKIAAALRKVLEKSDLRLAEIGDPPPTSKNTKYKYDFYVVYDGKCSETSDWVYYHLRSQLEVGIDPLKGCIQERDFLPGKPILENMEDAVSNSAKIILILSKGFNENPWCKKATILALDPDYSHKVIPILREDVPTLPRHLKTLHFEDATKTINWSRIRQHLESA
ncbi:uncharacterized protein [Amphiura filiformis]|uniref:uncharacterized protein n=1 Tax=Amphiura filiformis TaxID=82378 RepID=UPI003B20C897